MTKRKTKQPKQQPKVTKLNLQHRTKPLLAEVIADQTGPQNGGPQQAPEWKPGDKPKLLATVVAQLERDPQNALYQLRLAQEEDEADKRVWFDSNAAIPERLAAHMRMVKRRSSGLIRD